MKIAININEYDEFVVTIGVSREDAWAAYVRMVSAKTHRFFDGDDGFASFVPEDPWAPGVTIVWGDECFIRFDGVCRPEGDDRLDGAFASTELSLDDRIAVANLARNLISGAPQ